MKQKCISIHLCPLISRGAPWEEAHQVSNYYIAFWEAGKDQSHSEITVGCDALETFKFRFCNDLS